MTNSLARLILTRKDDLELTYPAIATRGGFTSHSIVHALATKQTHQQIPRPQTIAGLARALEVPRTEVLTAAVNAVLETWQLNDEASD